ncbi:MAG: hypothetical protein JXR97_04235 [Planctomycetes bacterium]|nr:hypothetical protein [Planctomycetota bacterium]
MDSVEQSIRTQKLKLEAYSKARPMLEQHKHDHFFLQSAAEIVLEFLAEQGRHFEMAMLVQDAMNYIALGLQKLEARAVEESGKIENPRVIVAWNDTAKQGHCGVCGKPGVELAEGPELFIEGEDAPVCEACAEKYTPGLVGLMRVFKRNPQFVSVLRDMRNTDEVRSESPESQNQPRHDKIQDQFGGF